MQTKPRNHATRAGLLASFLLAAAPLGCGPAPTAGSAAGGGAPGAQSQAGAGQTVVVDGSSTLGPMIDLAKELFDAEHKGINVQVRTSGSNSGFARLLSENSAERIDICKASRPIAQEEIRKAAALKIEFIELPIAIEGIVLVVNPKNDFVATLTMAELKRIWEPDSRINNWKDVRAGFPDLPLKLFGAGPQSGTFDVFTERVVGKAKQCRKDYVASENDNVLVTGVAAETGALGYFGLSYLEENRGKVKAVAIDAGTGEPLAPEMDAIRKGTYPLSRPLFLYVSKEAAARPAVRAFLDFIMKDPARIVEHEHVRCVTLSEQLYAKVRERLETGRGGSVYTSPESYTKQIGELLAAPPASEP